MMRFSFRRAFSLLFGFALFVSLLSCDSAGVNGPAWTGNWSISSVGGVQPDADLDYRITEDNFIVVSFTGSSCDISEGSISSTDGNVLTVSFGSGTSTIRAEADEGGTSGSTVDDEITLTVQDGRIPGGTGTPSAEAGETVQGSALTGDPRDKCD